jgi:amino acid transporter
VTSESRQATPTAPRAGSLRRQLGFWGTASLCVGGMAPTLAMSVTGVQPARIIGRAAPLAYVIAAVGIALVGYSFVRLSERFAHAGSVYAYIGSTLGPRAGFFAGWMLMCTYIVFPPVSVLGMAVFAQALVVHVGIAGSVDWLPLALVSWVLTGVLAYRGIKLTARSIIVVEVVSLVFIGAIVAVVFVKLGLGSVPAHQGLTTDVFRIPTGANLSAVALAATFGFLSYGGFESSMSVGEESEAPRRMIPRSIVVAVAFGGVFYTACIAAQTLGFGTDAAGIRSFASSGAPLADLARMYTGHVTADLLDVAALLSALGAGLAGVAVASRTLFALARDGLLPRQLAGVSSGTATPALAVVASMAVTVVPLLAFGVGSTRAIDAFFYLATVGILSLFVLYMLTSLSALKLVLLGESGAPLWQSAVPVAGIAVAGYVLYRNVVPVPAYPFNLFPYIVGAWLVLGVALVLAVPAIAERVSRGLGLAPGAALAASAPVAAADDEAGGG